MTLPSTSDFELQGWHIAVHKKADFKLTYISTLKEDLEHQFKAEWLGTAFDFRTIHGYHTVSIEIDTSSAPFGNLSLDDRRLLIDLLGEGVLFYYHNALNLLTKHDHEWHLDDRQPRQILLPHRRMAKWMFLVGLLGFAMAILTKLFPPGQ